MELTELINSVHAIQVVGEVQRKDVAAIVYDSRKVINNSIFVAIKGYKTDGHKYILDAISKGALAVILEDNNVVPDNIFVHEKIAKILVANSRKALAEISHEFFKSPSNKLKLIGVTGTNGKTTTTFILKSIFETAGEKAGVIGTISNYTGQKEVKSSLTTPEANDLNEMLYEMYTEGCNYAVMEVSSHSLVLNRVYGLEFSAAVFTNITSDHLDFHHTFDNYLNAKKILFNSLSESVFGVYNIDDINSPKIVNASKAKLFSYGTTSSADFILKNIKYNLTGTNFIIEHKGKEIPLSTSLVGEFNAYNAAAAYAVSVLLGIDEDTAAKGINNTKQVPGRFEVLGKKDKKIIIDYSHTSDSLEKTLLAIRNIVKEMIPIYTVFGCGGDRDKTKRPLMGKIASDLSSVAIITSDNPRTENPFSIIDEIKAGMSGTNYKIIENREEAIKTAIEQAEDNAVILIAGKGHEDYQEINGVRHHFSDKEIAEKYLNL